MLEAWDALFNRRDYRTAEKLWSETFIQHSSRIPPGRDGLFNRVKTMPQTLRYENNLAMADGDYVMLHGRFSGNGEPKALIAADVLRIEDA